MAVGCNYYHGPGISTWCAVKHALHTLFLFDEERLLLIDEVQKNLPACSDYYLYKISDEITRAFLKEDFPVTMNAGLRSAWKDLDSKIGQIIRERAYQVSK